MSDSVIVCGAAWASTKRARNVTGRKLVKGEIVRVDIVSGCAEIGALFSSQHRSAFLMDGELEPEETGLFALFDSVQESAGWRDAQIAKALADAHEAAWADIDPDDECRCGVSVQDACKALADTFGVRAEFDRLVKP